MAEQDVGQALVFSGGAVVDEAPAFGSPVVETDVVFFGVAIAAVIVERSGCSSLGSLGGEKKCHGCESLSIGGGGFGIQHPKGALVQVVGGLKFCRCIGQTVLHCLEAADGSVELVTLQSVFNTDLQGTLPQAADRCCCESLPLANGAAKMADGIGASCEGCDFGRGDWDFTVGDRKVGCVRKVDERRWAGHSEKITVAESEENICHSTSGQQSGYQVRSHSCFSGMGRQI